MPYLTKLEREKRDWMTLADTVRHVVDVEGDCLVKGQSPSHYKSQEIPAIWETKPMFSPADEAALLQVQAALNDGEIPIRWGQGGWPESTSFDFDTIFAIDVPLHGPFWKFAEITKEFGVWDGSPVGFYEGGYDGNYHPPRQGNLRQLLLHRVRVYELWPKRTASNSSRPTEADVFSKVQPPPRPTREDFRVLVRAEARKLYADGRPNIRVAEELIAAVLGGSRERVREVLREDEFKLRRRPAGNSRPRSQR